MKKKIAVVRGAFLNQYEMQFFEPLTKDFSLTGFGSLCPYHSDFSFPVVRLPSPMDLPYFPYKMPILNRIFSDAHYLIGLEDKLKGYDLVHTAETYFHYTQQCLNAKKKGYVKKVIATVLENIPFNNEGIWDRKRFKRRARTELDHIIALTRLTQEALIKEGADERKITVIGHFIDTKRFHPLPHKDISHRLRILFCGRLEVYKGVYDLLGAAQRLIRDRDLTAYNVEFLFVGNGREKEPMLKLEKSLGLDSRIHHQSVSYDETPSVYQQADIFVAPSRPTPTWQEQYSTVLLEAQATGLPIVTTKTGGIPENIGNAGVLVEPGDVAGITRAIKNFILSKNLRKTYGLKARWRAVKVHDMSVGAKRLSDLYNSLL